MVEHQGAVSEGLGSIFQSQPGDQFWPPARQLPAKYFKGTLLIFRWGFGFLPCPTLTTEGVTSFSTSWYLKIILNLCFIFFRHQRVQPMENQAHFAFNSFASTKNTRRGQEQRELDIFSFGVSDVTVFTWLKSQVFLSRSLLKEGLYFIEEM